MQKDSTMPKDFELLKSFYFIMSLKMLGRLKLLCIDSIQKNGHLGVALVT